MAGYTESDVSKALAYDPETGRLTWCDRDPSEFASPRLHKFWRTKYAGKAALTSANKRGYLGGKFMGSYLSAHRAAFVCMNGKFPPDEVDHIDGDKGNNKWSNLRPATRSENCSNRALHSNNTSGEVGVSFDAKSKKWRAKIKNDVIGLFEDWADAVTARRLASAIDGNFTKRHGI